MTREVTATEAKAKLLALPDDVEDGESVEITRHGRLVARIVPATPGIAATAAGLGAAFPSDPFDRIIYATAIEHGWQIVTQDRRMHDSPADRAVAVW